MATLWTVEDRGAIAHCEAVAVTYSYTLHIASEKMLRAARGSGDSPALLRHAVRRRV